MASAIVEKAVIRAREAFSRKVTLPVEFRINQLQRLRKCIDDNYDHIVDAMKKDFSKPRFESVITEIEYVKNDIQYQLDHINGYVKPQPVEKGFANFFDDCLIKYDPYGVVLIFGAWNYPIQLPLCPLIGAITAGNCAVLKPSEVASNTEQLLSRILPKYLDSNCYPVVTGGPEVAQQILNEKFDLIFFTGSPSIGKQVYQAASKHMTPCVLELGGKSPVWIDRTIGNSANLEVAVKRILWGKFINSGQTCIAPDYILTTPDVQEKFVETSRQVLKTFYQDDPKDTDSYARIVNERNFNRLDGLLNRTKALVAVGGQTDKSERYISPTVVANVTPSDSLMSEELFGPILPIVTVQSPEEAIEFVNRGEKPLSMYIFSNDKNVVQKFLTETSSGSVCVNDTLMQMAGEFIYFINFGLSN